MALRHYNNTAQPTSLTGGINDTTNTVVVDDASGFPTHPFTIAVDRGTADEEAMLVTNVSGNTFTVTRGFDDTTASAHLLGASVEHCMVAEDLRDANEHIWDEERDDHPQYLNEDRLALWLPETFTGGSITKIATMDSTYKTHRQLTITSAPYERKAQLSAMLPFALVNGSVSVVSRIYRSGVFYSACTTYGQSVMSHTHVSKWVTIPANESWTFDLQAHYGSNVTGGSTDDDPNLNIFTALVVRSA